ncbi:MAG: hypothetical protein RIE73_34420 [Coleofasciculus sp. C1-SOL-03]|uniref:hypothetical protein n=1 Tax=Coleofasciculus sp. C1-SOL-03 TaxID=3069522 RepID=UPI0032F200BC
MTTSVPQIPIPIILTKLTIHVFKRERYVLSDRLARSHFTPTGAHIPRDTILSKPTALGGWGGAIAHLNDYRGAIACCTMAVLTREAGVSWVSGFLPHSFFTVTVNS